MNEFILPISTVVNVLTYPVVGFANE